MDNHVWEAWEVIQQRILCDPTSPSNAILSEAVKSVKDDGITRGETVARAVLALADALDRAILAETKATRGDRRVSRPGVWARERRLIEEAKFLGDCSVCHAAPRRPCQNQDGLVRKPHAARPMLPQADLVLRELRQERRLRIEASEGRLK